MTPKDIATIRLHNQQLHSTKPGSPEAVVAWMGAMQAQDYAMSKWAVGTRLHGSSDEAIEQAISNGSIMRTHVLRPTWHLVAATDIHWMLELTAPHVKATAAFMNRQLELDDKIFKRSNAIIGKTLRDGNHLTREELMAVLGRSGLGIETNSLRAAHLMFDAELSGIVCNGPRRGKEHTYALLHERVHKPKSIQRDEAAAKLALRYFTGHGPATLQDFIWWSGLPAKDAKAALEAIRSKLLSETIHEQIYWFFPMPAKAKKSTGSIYFLPAFDEFLISYKDRSAAIDVAAAKHAFTSNGIFKPVIVVNGTVTGTWKRTIKKDAVLIEAQFFHTTGNPDKQELINAATAYGDFMKLKTIL